MNSLISLFSTINDYPWFFLSVFLVIAFLVLSILSSGKIKDALHGIWKIVCSFFIAPFNFLKRSMLMFSSLDEQEAPYRSSHEYLAYVFNRFNYLLITVGAILILSGGISSALVALYPKIEIEQQQSLKQELEAANNELDNAKKALEDASKPDYQSQLKKELEKAQQDYDGSKKEVQKARDELTKSGDGLQLDEVLYELLSLESEDAIKSRITSINENIDSKCGGWDGFTSDKCQSLKKNFTVLGDVLVTVLSKGGIKDQAENAYNNIDNAKKEAESRVSNSSELQLTAQKAYDEVSIWKFQWLSSHLSVFKGIMLATVGLVVVIVWSWALIVELFSWIILMMLSLERRNSPK